MQQTALVIALTVLAALAVVQILAASGRPVGRLLWGGSKRILPTRLRLASVGAVCLYAGFAYVLLAQANGHAPHGTGPVTVLSWVLFAYLVLATVANLRSRSKAERAVMAPASAVLAAATLIVVLA